MRIIVCGGRDYDDALTVETVMRALGPHVVVVNGAARGTDTLSDHFASKWGKRSERHPADWTAPCRDTCRPGHRRPNGVHGDYCPAAGNYRNQEMADAGAHLCIAFPGGRGTADMVSRARKAGIVVLEVS